MNLLGLEDRNNTNNNRWTNTIDALHHVAIDDLTWDCWINHYVANTWEDLRDYHNVSWAFELLGWSESTWRSDDENDWPDSELKFYAELNSNEQLGARRICCPAEVWDGKSLTEWEYNEDGVSAVQLSIEMSSSTNNQIAATPIIEDASNPTSSPNPTDQPTEYVRKTIIPTIAPTKIPSSPPSFIQQSSKQPISPSGGGSSIFSGWGGNRDSSDDEDDAEALTITPSTMPSDSPHRKLLS
ncbi:hypothetical protein FRACYDRAFT_197257 [Fragilariopsis cylindrus CCMP1102]|uniref:Uncharacterized protein n=1 Tax=Fragilariopsis cylindrus CCMP1102 TaxID=635003 RepID=A0A1E7EQD7_9STRA|nr:hypothetical protein FRACYDRAFT_197257 [Fragilariopsis cylindrus CCMP1102]|eukprot:OEU07753.1 hypothetical protein FRACYDRAFT_197257 [Fragilariopsis cylindrus CCMP1102]